MNKECVFLTACKYNGVKKCQETCKKRITIQEVENLKAISGKK